MHLTDNFASDLSIALIRVNFLQKAVGVPFPLSSSAYLSLDKLCELPPLAAFMWRIWSLNLCHALSSRIIIMSSPWLANKDPWQARRGVNSPSPQKCVCVQKTACVCVWHVGVPTNQLKLLLDYRNVSPTAAAAITSAGEQRSGWSGQSPGGGAEGSTC